jgi:hypothetical protein
VCGLARGSARQREFLAENDEGAIGATSATNVVGKIWLRRLKPLLSVLQACIEMPARCVVNIEAPQSEARLGRHEAVVENAARTRLACHFHFHGWADNFRFAFDDVDAVLSVQGTVPSFYLKQLVQNVLKGLDGVRRIDNRLEVISLLSSANARFRLDGGQSGGASGGGPHHGREQRTS